VVLHQYIHVCFPMIISNEKLTNTTLSAENYCKRTKCLKNSTYQLPKKKAGIIPENAHVVLVHMPHYVIISITSFSTIYRRHVSNQLRYAGWNNKFTTCLQQLNVFFITFKYASCIVGTWLFDNTHKTNRLSNVYINIDECMHMFQLLLRLTLI
jgi:hypothetical protein